jgi:hypothetical protein
MSVDERSRLQLAEAAKRILGDDEGITLMELLPPVGWADVATKADLLHIERRFDELDVRLDLRFEGVDRRFDELDVRLDLRFSELEHRMDARFERGFRSVVVTMMSLFITGFVAAILAIVFTR